MKNELTIIKIPKSDIVRYLVLHTLGNFFVLFGLFGVVMTFGPAFYYETNFRLEQAQGVKYVVADETSPHFPGEASGGGLGNVSANEKILIPKDTNFSLLIPKIGADAKVFANTDPTDENQYLPVLKEGVAHAKGSVFPGMDGATYMFAHSTDSIWDVGRYNAVFYLLKDLSVNDQVVVFFSNRRYNYTVSETKIIDGNDVSDLVDAQKGPERLVLQTCWPPGTTLKRLLVTALPSK